MATWPSTLDRAGITHPVLRDDYSAQRQLVARYARAEYTAVRLLLPTSIVPDVIAATAFMHSTDDRIDQGPVPERVAALAEWDGRVRAALESGSADDPVLRALLDTLTRHPQLRAYVQEFLTGAPLEVHSEGFATEGDFQRYIDAYSLPGFMLIACLLTPPVAVDAYVAGCRTFIEASQRLDFLEDIAEDLSQGRLGIPQDALARHGLTRTELVEAAASTGPRFTELMDQQASQIRSGLTASHCLVELIEEPHRPLIRALVTLQELRLRAVERKGPALLHGSPRPPLAAALGVLAREYRTARRHSVRSSARSAAR